MADGTFPGLVSKDTAVNAVANPIWVELTDGTTAIGVTSNALDVNIAGGSTGTEYAVDVAAGAADLGSLVLVVRVDVLTALTPVDGDYVQLRVGSTGALWTTFTNTTIDVGTVTTVTTLTGITNDVNIADGGNVISVDDGGGILTVDGTVAATQSGAWTVTATATQLDIDDLNLTDDAVRISGNSTANGVLNPIFVQTVNTAVLGDEIHNYDTTAAVAAGGTDNHDYTVAGTTFLLKSVIFSGSGSVKAEIQTGPVAGLVTKAVAFLTGRQGDTQQLFFDPPIEVPATSTGTVRVIRTNRQGSATDVYSTIIGNDVA